MKTVYQTADGKIFDQSPAAIEHEDTLFKAWRDKIGVDLTYDQLWTALEADEDRLREGFNSERGELEDLLRSYWKKLPWDQQLAIDTNSIDVKIVIRRVPADVLPDILTDIHRELGSWTNVIDCNYEVSS